MMATSCTMQLSHDMGIRRHHGRFMRVKVLAGKSRRELLGFSFSSKATISDVQSLRVSKKKHQLLYVSPCKYTSVTCKASFIQALQGQSAAVPAINSAVSALSRSYSRLQGSPLLFQLVPAVGVVAFSLWGLMPLGLFVNRVLFHCNENSWKKSKVYYFLSSYVRPLLLWTGATLACSAFDPLILPTEASQAVKQRILNFVRSLSTVLAFAYCLSSLIQQTQKFFMEMNDSADPRNMGFDFAGKAIYSAVWIAAVSLFMELLGFSTQKWLTAGGLGTVLITLAGREIFTNFLSSVMIHATRPFVLNEWIQTKIEGYEVSGTVEHVGWWSPTIIRGDDREAVHIPNHKFTVNVVRNLSQKTHWRIKTHLAISHLDVGKINNIVADMRKVLAKNPHVEQQRLHRRVFLENINPENQALTILISCFVKTSHFEEYLCVKEAILLDLLRVISHHRARLATPIRTVQKFYGEADIENIPFSETIINRGVNNRPLLLIEHTTRTNLEEKAKARSSRLNDEQEVKSKSTEGKEPTSDLYGAESKQESKQEEKSKERAKTDAASVSSPAVTTVTSSQVQKPAGAKDAAASITKDVSVGIVSEKQSSESSEGVSDKPDGVSTQPTKSISTEKAASSAAASRSVLEDNIILGVALEGSKMTLPIEEPLEEKELAAIRSGSSSSNPVVKDKEVQEPSAPTSTSGDQ